MARNPNWNREELILALDLYFRLGRTQLSPDHEDVVELSRFLISLPIHDDSRKGSSFRNPQGVSMKLGNFRRLDPEYEGTGLKQGSKSDEIVWNEFADTPDKLHETALLIRNKYPKISPSPGMSWPDEIVQAFIELGGEATYQKLYDYIEENTERDLPASWKEIIRARIEERSSDSSAFKGQEDLFYSVGGIGSGRWGLRSWDKNWITLEDEIQDGEEFYESAVRKIYVNRYERDSKARDACIEHFGSLCQVCGFSFEEEFGDLATGFIHVHHIIPLSKVGEDYIVDPVNDLIPVCPNCHAVLHLLGSPMKVETLRELINQESK